MRPVNNLEAPKRTIVALSFVPVGRVPAEEYSRDKPNVCISHLPRASAKIIIIIIRNMFE